MSEVDDAGPAPQRGHEAIERIVLECLDAVDLTAAVEQACADHPRHADLIRRTVARLQQDPLFHATGGDRELREQGLAIPRRLGNYRLIRKLGEGGMGVVFLARDEHLGRDVAVKLVRPDLVIFGQSRQRFAREVEAVARLHDPGIVSIVAVGEEEGLPYFVMERIVGTSLAERIAAARTGTRARLSARDLLPAFEPASAESASASHAEHRSGSWNDAALRLVRRVAAALDHAHRQGVLHRDLKPSNILIDRTGRPVLIDFGLARIEGAPELTRSTAQLGSLPYTPPEALDGSAAVLDARSDVYSLGVTLYETLTLQSPFFGQTAEETRQRILAGEFRRPRLLVPAISWEAETVCLKAMDREPRRRYDSMAALLGDLDAVLERRPVQARRAGVVLRLRRLVQRHPTRSLALLGALLLFVVLPIAAAIWQAGVATELRITTARAERNAYLASLGAASAGLLANTIDRVHAALRLSPPRLRRWEWRYLAGVADGSQRRWQLDGGDVLSLIPLAGGASFLAALRSGTVELRSVTDAHLPAVRHYGDRLLAAALRPNAAALYVTTEQRPALWRSMLTDGQIGAPELLAELDAPAASLAFDSRGELLALGLDGGGVELRDGRGDLIATLRDEQAVMVRVHALEFSPADRHLAAAIGGTVALFREPFATASGIELEFGADREIRTPLMVTALTWLDDENLLASDNQTQTTHFALPSRSGRLLSRELAGPTLLLDGGRRLAGNRRNRIEVLERDGWRASGPARRGHASRISAMAQPDPRHLLTGDVSGEVRLWDLMAPPDEHTAGNKVLGLATTTGDTAACVALASGAIGRLDLETVRFEEMTRASARLVSHAVSQQHLAFIADDLVLVARHGDRAEEHVALPFQPDACGFAADGTLYVVGEHGTLARVPAGRFEPDRVTKWPAPSATRFKYLVVPADGHGPAALATDGTLVHWPVAEQQPRVLGTHPEATDLIAAAKSAVLYTAGLDGCVRSWPLAGHDQDAGKVVLQWPGQLLTAVALDERGGRLFAGTMLGRLAVFELDTGELLLEMPGHAGGPTDLVFFDQQQVLLSSSWNGQIRIHRAQ